MNRAIALALILGCLAGGVAAAEPPSTKVYELTGVAFDFNSDKLLPASNEKLDAAAKMLKENYAGTNVEIAGHTDFTGNEAYNKDLSQRRAEAVRQYLIKAGIDAGQLTAVGYGSSQPLADNHLKSGRARNRRVELRTSTFPWRP